MKHLVEIINENLRLDEAKKVKVVNLVKDLDKIDKWATEKNIKDLIASYMSAGDAEDITKEHWVCCVDVVKEIIKGIKLYIEGYADEIVDLIDMTEWLENSFEDPIDDFIDNLNKKDKDCDWDIDEIINLFNTVSMKVCKAAWL